MQSMRKIFLDIYRNNAFRSFALNVFFLIMVLICCDMKYEVSDDFIVDTILSGAYGNGYDEHLLFSNILYGYFLKFLYENIPMLSWYFIMQIVICFCALWAVTYIIYERNSSYIGLILSICFVSFFSDDVYILVQFTKTAAISICSGGMLILFGFWNTKKTCITLGEILFLMGSMIRFDALFVAAGFLFIVFLDNIWERREHGKILQKTAACIGLCVGTILCTFLLNWTDVKIWNQNEEYGRFKEYNSRRASITDVNGYGSASLMPQLEPLGISLNDYYMIESWEFIDENYFTNDKLEQIAQIKKQYSDGVTKNVRYIFSCFLDRHYEKYTVFWGSIALFIFAFLFCIRKWRWQMSKVALIVLLLMYFMYRGRVVYRVEYAVFVCGAISIVTSIHGKKESALIKRIIPLCTILLLACKIPLYVPDTSYKEMDDEEYNTYIYNCFYESWNYDLKKYRCNVTERQPHGKLISNIMKDTEHYYLIDFTTGIQLIYLNYKPWLRVPQNMYNHYSYIGGVTMGYVDNYKVWQEKGIDSRNLFKSIENENIYIIDNNYYSAKLGYIQEHYDEDAKVKLVKSIDGFNVWKYTN